MKNTRTKPLFIFQLTRRQLFTLVSLGVLGIALAVFAYFFLSRLEQENINAVLMRSARNHATKLQERIDDNLNEIVSLESFYLSSEFVTRQEFAIFAQSIMHHEIGIQALEWIPFVPASEREDFEERARQDGFTDFVITERLEQES